MRSDWWGRQVICYEPGDYSGPHNDHHPEHAEIKNGFVDVHIMFSNDAVASQLLAYEERGFPPRARRDQDRLRRRPHHVLQRRRGLAAPGLRRARLPLPQPRGGRSQRHRRLPASLLALHDAARGPEGAGGGGAAVAAVGVLSFQETAEEAAVPVLTNTNVRS